MANDKKNYSPWVQSGSGIEVIKPAKQQPAANRVQRSARKPLQVNTKRKAQK